MSRPMLLAAAALACASLAGCGQFGGPPLVSAQYPPGTGAVNSNAEPEPIGSLPVGAANISRAPGAYQPNYASITFGGLR